MALLRESLFKPHIPIRKKTVLNVALVYPEAYSIGMSNLGFQVIYSIFASYPDIRVERFFYSKSIPRSLEAGRTLKEFDLIALSLSFEPDFLKFIEMLRASDIPLFSFERPPGMPPILGGGIAISSNPSLYARFLDMMFLGEAEDAIYTAIEIFTNSKKGRWKTDRQQLLERIAALSGFYVPLVKGNNSIKRAEAENLDRLPACSSVISKDADFKDMFLLELNRGCPWKCLFCLIAWTGGRTRFLSREKAMEKIKEGLRFTERIGLVGTALVNYNEAGQLLDDILKSGGKISFSSLRLAPGFTEFLEVLEKSGQKMVTVAPEAGSENLRYLLGKEIPDSEIENIIRSSVRIGLSQIKLYFMYGLPREKEGDIEAIVSLLHRLRKISRRLKFVVSLSPFIPKPWTPLQWAPMEREEALRYKLDYLKKKISTIGGVRVTAESIRQSICEGLLSRGDSEIIEKILSSSPRQMEEIKEKYIYRDRARGETFPWDFVDNGLDKKKIYTVSRRIL